MKRFALFVVLAGASLALAAGSGRTASQKICPNHGGGKCLGVLRAGTYTTIRFTPTLTYTVPAAWANWDDTLGIFSLTPPGVSLTLTKNAIDDIIMFKTVQAPAMRCTGNAPAANVSETASGIAHWLAHHPGLRTTQPQPVAIGGLTGYVLTVRLAPTGGLRCGGSFRWVPVLMGGLGREHGEYSVGGQGDHALVYLLNVAGSTLGIVADSAPGKHPPSLAADAAVIKQFQFKSH